MTNPNHSNVYQVPQMKSERRRSLRERLSVAGATGVIGAIALTGCGDNVSAKPPEKEPTQQTVVDQNEQPPIDQGEQQGDDQLDHEQAPAYGELIPVEDQIFYTEDGEKLSYDELVASVEISAEEGVSATELPNMIFNSLDDGISHIVPEEEVRHNLNIPADPKAEGYQEFPSQEQYDQASEAYFDAYIDALFVSPEGEMPETFRELRSQAHFDWLVSTGLHAQNPETNPLYDMDIKYLPASLSEGRALNAFVVTDNADKVQHVDEGKNTGVYTFDWRTGEGIEKSSPIDGIWQLKSNMIVTRTDPAQQ